MSSRKRYVEASPIVFVHELDFVTVHNKKLQNLPGQSVGSVFQLRPSLVTKVRRLQRIYVS